MEKEISNEKEQTKRRLKKRRTRQRREADVPTVTNLLSRKEEKNMKRNPQLRLKFLSMQKL